MSPRSRAAWFGLALFEQNVYKMLIYYNVSLATTEIVCGGCGCGDPQNIESALSILFATLASPTSQYRYNFIVVHPFDLQGLEMAALHSGFHRLQIAVLLRAVSVPAFAIWQQRNEQIIQRDSATNTRATGRIAYKSVCFRSVY